VIGRVWARRSVVATLGLVLGQLPALEAGAAEPSTAHVVPADDTALALLLLAARGATEPVLLFDPSDRSGFDRFRSEWRGVVRCVHRTGTSAGTATLLREATGGACVVVDDLFVLARALWPNATSAILTTEAHYKWMLRSATLAGATNTALLILGERAGPDLAMLEDWRLRTIYVARPALEWAEEARAVAPGVVELPSADVFTTAYLRALGSRPTAVVIANPLDRRSLFSPSSLSLLAPLVSAVHRAPLFLVEDAPPETIEQATLAFLERHVLSPSHVILVGDELALRSHRVPDPVLVAGGPEARGGGTEVRVELFSDIDRDEPQDFAVGRIVGEGAGQASATLARQYHLPRGSSARPVIFFTNADGIFRLGETISRTTAAELRNVGVAVKAYYGEKISHPLIQKSLTATDVLVWEGHARDLTLEEQGGIAAKGAPDLVILQGCYTFDRSDPFILMDKGTVAIVGTSTAIYSASGSALARAFFDALLYDGADLGTATRNARNFLLALTHLKRARKHSDWRKTYRAALAFALWGDPTLRPNLATGEPKLAPMTWAREDQGLTLTIPARGLDRVAVGRFVAEPPPRSMLSGLLLREPGTEQRRLKELFFTAQRVDDGLRAVCAPRAGWEVVSMLAPRTRTLFVLARPDWKLMELPGPAGTFTFPMAPDASACPPVPAVPAT
jgi:hypothetical protein